MALTTEERSVLVIARHRIRYQDSSTLCGALQHIRQLDPLLTDATLRLQRYLNESLFPSSTLIGWQCEHDFGIRTEEQRRQDRIDWINWMLGAELQPVSKSA